MFARCPELFIQSVITCEVEVCPWAIFSPQVVHGYPAAVIRVPALDPPLPVWLNVPVEYIQLVWL